MNNSLVGLMVFVSIGIMLFLVFALLFKIAWNFSMPFLFENPVFKKISLINSIAFLFLLFLLFGININYNSEFDINKFLDNSGMTNTSSSYENFGTGTDLDFRENNLNGTGQNN